RKVVLVAYQKRKLEEIRHPFLGEQTTIGLLPHLQARLLARHLRGELDAYPPCVWRGSGEDRLLHSSRGALMFVLASYDVAATTRAGRRRLRRVARACLGYGQRAQNSGFER